MHQVNVSELRDHLPEYLARAESGEEILVTRRGRIVARLSAVHDVRAEAKRQLAALRVRARLGDVVGPIGEHWGAEG
jgi:prevent-host-death family protein